MTKGAGEVSFAPRNVPHTLANHRDAPARYLLICTPAGFERHWAPHRRRGRRSQAAAVGAAADPRGHDRRAADRGAGLSHRSYAPALAAVQALAGSRVSCRDGLLAGVR